MQSNRFLNLGFRGCIRPAAIKTSPLSCQCQSGNLNSPYFSEEAAAATEYSRVIGMKKVKGLWPA